MTRLQEGDVLATREFGPLTTQMFVRYSGASGDLNPIHYDQDFARAAGYPTVFSQGMHHAALLATFVTDWAGAASVRRFSVRFRDQVWPGDVLRCDGEVTALRDVEGTPLATLALTMTSQRDVVVLAGEADVVAASR